MDVSPIIIAIWAGGGACLLAGGALIGWGALARRPRTLPNDGEFSDEPSEPFCPCCGYSTEGLECNTCPECGQGMWDARMRVLARRRAWACAAGLLLVLIAGLAPLIDHGSRVGWAHVLPSGWLAYASEHVAALRPPALRHLMGRAEGRLMTLGERQRASEVTERVLASDTRTDVRREAAALLRAVAENATDSSVSAALRDRDPVIRQCGVQALARSCRQERPTTTILLHIASRDRSDRVRREAVEALRLRGLDDPRRVSFLDSALEDASTTVQIRAIYAIGDSQAVPPKTLAAVISKLGASDDGVREAALWALARINSRNGLSMSAVVDLLRDGVVGLGAPAVHRM